MGRRTAAVVPRQQQLTAVFVCACVLLLSGSHSPTSGSSQTIIPLVSAFATGAGMFSELDLGTQEKFQKSAKPHVPHEYCCCTTKKVDENTGAMLDVLNKIVQRPYFRYFKVDVKKPCAYWTVNLLCQSADNPCQVCKCSADEVPFGLKKEADMGCPAKPGDEFVGLDRNLGQAGMGEDELWAGFQPSSKQQEGEKEGGEVSGATSGPEYIDLVKNPEGNTGYVGELANRIWEEIYESNCFQLGGGIPVTLGGPGVTPSPNPFDSSHAGNQQQPKEKQQQGRVSTPQCRQQQFLHQLISGLHASISTHISVRYARSAATCGVNCREFRRRVLDHEDRVDNMYTLYLLLLRAMTRAADSYLGAQHEYPANPGGSDDGLLRSQLQDLFHKELLCSQAESGKGGGGSSLTTTTTTFNESKILDTPEGRLLVPQYMEKLTNITTLMDCLTCEKCRVWGKLQTMGLATALKVVMTPAHTAAIVLSRAEKVTMMNLLRQVTVSINALTTACNGSGEEVGHGDL